jgi:ATPase family associated with various cellular activities (AAA)
MTTTLADTRAPDLAYLWARLGAVESRVRRAVAARAEAEPGFDDPHRGLYLTAEDVRRILDGPRVPLAPPEADPDLDALAALVPGGPRLLTLARRFELEPLDVEFLLIAMAPDVDARFEKLYGYLNDDVTRRRATVGLALELCGLPVAGAGRFRLAAAAPLVAGGLVEVREGGAPGLSRVLRVPDRVVAHLLGDDELGPEVAAVARVVGAGEGLAPSVGGWGLGSRGGGSDLAPGGGGSRSAPQGVGLASRGGNPGLPQRDGGSGSVLPGEGLDIGLARRGEALGQADGGFGSVPRDGDFGSARLGEGVDLGFVRPGGGVGAASAGGGLVRRVGHALDVGIRAVHLKDSDGDAGRLAVEALAFVGRDAVVVDVPAVAERGEVVFAALVREARLRGAGVVFGPLDLVSVEHFRLIRQLAQLAGDLPLLFYSKRHWDPQWTRQPVVSVPVPALDADGRAGRWAAALGEVAGVVDPALVRELAGYRLGADEVERAVGAAVRLAVLEDRPLGLSHVRAGVRAQNGAGLEQLARRITPGVGWDDLVLPEPTRLQLRELVVRARHRDRVLGQWRMRPGGGRGRGVVALFAGESGTGKTMSAEVVAAELGMDLYVVDLSSVVDKYIGETEKNLERIFSEAAGVHGVLLFDEADAVFGKRSEVKDSHDKHANMESAYLLQRMESFDGIAVLTTNLRSNVDEAFTRRIDVIADFPVPDAVQRFALWDRCLGTALPRGDDLDLEFCAERFELAGGSIRACVVTAAYLAAAGDRAVGMADVMAAVHREYRKLGRLVLPGEFGRWVEAGPVF